MKLFKYLLGLSVFLTACNSQRTITYIPETVLIEQRDLDTLVVSAPRMTDEEKAEGEEGEVVSNELAVYHPSHTRTNDLLHTKLDLKFDWENQQVLGKATLTFKPYFYPTDELVLDAKDFEFKKVSMQGQSKELDYDYDNTQLTIRLGREYQRDEKYTIFIDYVANPRETGGSAAITSDQGLFFINPTGEEGDKPMQIWTQGETEFNSRWFPTIDKPNERTTQEMYLTVDDKFKTLSNGLLQSSTKNSDGTRTDYWNMDQPHAPYLFMLAVGDFAVVSEKWENIPVDYYVEPEYEADAKAIFPYTPEMLTFFSDMLDIKYPWKKYAQIVVRDYVSGAMENTTAVVFGEYMQKHAQELVDDHTNEKVVAHEMFHHWFGDLVTIESWANLTLNEGFANYSEYLWMENKHGRDAADYHLLEEWNGYFNSAQSEVHPLIHYRYEDKENMFDAHSYNKGGSVLHMLRTILGDEAFFLGLNKYLKEHTYESVEVHDLRLAFEETSGLDLNWFFNQWYLSAGHPVLQITSDYDEAAKSASLRVVQTQPADNMPAIFQLPVAVDLYTADGKAERHEILINQRDQTFSFEAATAPKLINFDAERTLLGIQQYDKTDETLIFQFKNGKKFLDRFEALQNLEDLESEGAKEVFGLALKDPFWVIRAIGLDAMDSTGVALLPSIRELAANDKHTQVRAYAFAKLAELGDKGAVDIAKKVLDSDAAYSVISAAFYYLSQVDEKEALNYAEKLEKVEDDDIINALGELYAKSEDPKYLYFFQKNIDQPDGPAAMSFFRNFQTLAANAEPAEVSKIVDQLGNIAIDMTQSIWRRFSATQALSTLRSGLEEDGDAEELVKTIGEKIEEIKSKETDDQLRMLYQQL